MASLTLLAFLSFVFVILLVAREAIHRQLVFDQVALMAVSAFQRRRFVFAEQGEFGLLVVIEDRFLPIVLIMAGLALGAEFTFVGLVVILLVARDTGHL